MGFLRLFLLAPPRPGFFPPPYRGGGNRGKVRQSRKDGKRESRENRKEKNFPLERTSNPPLSRVAGKRFQRPIERQVSGVLFRIRGGVNR